MLRHPPLLPSMLRFGAATLFVISCAPVPEEPPRGTGGRSSQGGSFSTSGAPSFGGGTGFGGSGTSGGSGQTSGGSGQTSGGATTTTGGAGTTTGGTATGTGGGATTMGGSSTTSGGATTTTGGSGTAASCDPLPAPSPIVYDGAATASCGNTAKAPYVGYWYTFNDETVGAMQTPAKGGDGGYVGAKPGKGGAEDCGFHTTGSGFSKWGGGVGLDFHNFMGKSCPLDATAFTGIQFSVKGSSKGTQGDMYAKADNMLRVNLTSTTELMGDDFGGWCPLTADWTVCKIDFATAKRVGYNMTATATAIDKTKLVKIQFQTSKLMAEPSVSFDFWIDDLAFY